MDIAFLLDKYFKGTNNVSIDVFDAQTLNAVYRNVVSAMTSHFEIEVSVLQALSYCLYEMPSHISTNPVKSCASSLPTTEWVSRPHWLRTKNTVTLQRLRLSGYACKTQ